MRRPRKPTQQPVQRDAWRSAYHDRPENQYRRLSLAVHAYHTHVTVSLLLTEQGDSQGAREVGRYEWKSPTGEPLDYPAMMIAASSIAELLIRHLPGGPDCPILDLQPADGVPATARIGGFRMGPGGRANSAKCNTANPKT